MNIIVICNRFNWKLNIAERELKQSSNELVLCSEAWIAKGLQMFESEQNTEHRVHETLSATLCCVTVSLSHSESKKTNDDYYVKWHHSSPDDDTTLKHSDALIIWSHSTPKWNIYHLFPVSIASSLLLLLLLFLNIFFPSYL